jgi:2-phosphosulfolactate phosphatase
MRLHVAFLPALVSTGRPGSERSQVCLVVDVIRASSSLVTIVERGASRVLIAGDVASARQAAASWDNVVLAGEEEGLAPAGFDYGNSPVELARAALRGRPVVFVTTNGTVAIRAVKGAGAVLVAAMRNGEAVCREAWQESTARGDDLAIVCAGREGAFSVDDAYCAGSLVDALLHYGSADLTDGAIAALRLYRSEPDTLAMFSQSAAARNVVRLGLPDDVAYCAQRNVSDVVPRLGRELFLLEHTLATRPQ